MAIGKLRIVKPKESTQKNEQKPYEQVLRDSPIFHFIDRDVQAAQEEIHDLAKRMRDMEVKMAQMEGSINTLRAELSRRP